MVKLGWCFTRALSADWLQKGQLSGELRTLELTCNPGNEPELAGAQLHETKRVFDGDIGTVGPPFRR